MASLKDGNSCLEASYPFKSFYWFMESSNMKNGYPHITGNPRTNPRPLSNLPRVLVNLWLKMVISAFQIPTWGTAPRHLGLLGLGPCLCGLFRCWWSHLALANPAVKVRMPTLWGDCEVNCPGKHNIKYSVNTSFLLTPTVPPWLLRISTLTGSSPGVSQKLESIPK